MRASTQTVGNLAMLMYALVTALTSILIHHTTQQIAPLLSAFYTFLFCILVYNGISKVIPSKLSLIKKSWFDVLMLNFTTAICWIFAFYSLKYIPPELYLFVYLCGMPIAFSFLYKTQWVKAAILFTGLMMLAMTYHGDTLLLGVSLAFVGGIFGTIYSIFSKKMTVDFSTLEILSLRFYLTVFITFLLSACFGKIQLMHVDFYLKFSLLSLISVVLPLTLFQVGIKNLHLTRALSYLPLAPLACYAINFICTDASFNPLQLTAVVFLSIAMLF